MNCFCSKLHLRCLPVLWTGLYIPTANMDQIWEIGVSWIFLKMKYIRVCDQLSVYLWIHFLFGKKSVVSSSRKFVFLLCEPLMDRCSSKSYLKQRNCHKKRISRNTRKELRLLLEKVKRINFRARLTKKLLSFSVAEKFHQKPKSYSVKEA